jgi:hypothetical protein
MKPCESYTHHSKRGVEEKSERASMRKSPVSKVQG